MKSKNDKTGHVSRKQFLRTVGSVVAGGSIVGVSAALLHRNMVRQAPEPASSHPAGSTPPVSPCKQIASLSVPDGVESFDLTDDRLMVAAASHIHICDLSGQPAHRFAVSGTVRDMAVNNGLIYLLFPIRIDRYSSATPPTKTCANTPSKAIS